MSLYICYFSIVKAVINPRPELVKTVEQQRLWYEVKTFQCVERLWSAFKKDDDILAEHKPGV